MLLLQLVRHGEAPKEIGQTDFERMLNIIGIAEGKEANKFLVETEAMPELIISSNAPRAIDTAKLVFADKKFSQSPEIYNADTVTLKEVISEIDDKYKSAAIVAHNPGITALVQLFNIQNLELHRNEALNYETTTKIVELSIDCNSWRDSFEANSKINYVFKPTQN